MKRYLQMATSILIALVLLLSLVPYLTVYADETGGVQERLNQILSDYPDGSYFTKNGKACTHGRYVGCNNCKLSEICKGTGKSLSSGQDGGMWTCKAFAAYVTNQVFGKKLAAENTLELIGKAKQNGNQKSSYADIKAGDLIYFYRTNNGKKDNNHIAVCMGTTNDAIVIYECNATGGTAQVSYRSIPYSQVCAGRTGKYVSIYHAINYDEINAKTGSETNSGRTGQTGLTGKTSKPIVSVSNAKVTVSWNYSGTSTNFDVYLVQSPWGWENIKYQSSTSSNSCSFENVAPGYYQAFVIARPNKDSAQSEWTAFSVDADNRDEEYYVILDDGSSCSRITVTNGSTYSNLTTPTRDGYTFDGWYTQQDGGSKVTTSTKVNLTGDQTLYAHWKRIISAPEVPKPETPEPETPIKNTEPLKTPNRYWGPWSEWSEIPVYGSSTREVETRTVTKQEKISDGYTEYRYVGYATSDGKHECWCETYLKNKFGSANLRYSDWSPTRYSANGTGWTCGQCSGSHTGVDHYGSDGRAWWAEYTLPDGKNYYWEETRTTEDQYRTYEVTEYRYRDLIED